MTRGVGLYLVGSLVLVSLAGCGRGFMFAEREPWRAEAEKACLKSGAVKESPDVVRIDPISGPGVCGAEFPLKVAALGESNSSLGYADESLRPPAGIGNQPRWPMAQPSYAPPPAPYPRSPSSQPPVYSAPSYNPPPQSSAVQSYPSPSSQARAPMPLNAPGTAPPDDEDEMAGGPDAPVSGAPARAPYASKAYSPTQPPSENQSYSQPSAPPRLGPMQGSPVSGVGPVALKPSATLACPIVSALDRWLTESVQPAAQRWFGSSVVEIKQISAYSCRGMNGNPRAHISEHAFGNALDIAAFTLADGRRISVKNGWKGMPEEQGFLRDVQGAACQQFNTVLAPGSNVYHYDHIHVDLMRRASGRVICEPSAVSGEEIAARTAARGGYAARDPGITGSILQKTKRLFARGPLSKDDEATIEDESRIQDR